MSSNGTTSLAVRRLPKAMNPGAATVAEHIEKVLPALPASIVNPDNFAHAAVVAANELSKPCHPVSVLTAALNCAKMGLMPGAAMGLAYFVPFKGQCQLIVGYRGYIDLAFRNNFLRDLHAEVVYQGESFRYWIDETGPRLTHEPSIDRDPDSDSVMAGYCIAQLASGGRQIRVMNSKQLQKSDTGTDPWKYNRHEMVLKTVIRRSAKSWKLTPEMSLAVHLDEQHELGRPQPVDTSLEAHGIRKGPMSLADLDDAPKPPEQQGGEQVDAGEQGEWEPSPDELADIRAAEQAEAMEKGALA